MAVQSTCFTVTMSITGSVTPENCSMNCRNLIICSTSDVPPLRITTSSPSMTSICTGFTIRL